MEIEALFVLQTDRVHAVKRIGDGDQSGADELLLWSGAAMGTGAHRRGAAASISGAPR